MSDEGHRPAQDPKSGRFVSGNIGGPGRGKGNRYKLGEAFIGDLYTAWKENGADIIARVIADDPAALLRSMVAILPKEVDVNVNKYDAMTDEQLRRQFAAALRDAAALGVDLGAGNIAGADNAAQAEQARDLSAVH